MLVHVRFPVEFVYVTLVMLIIKGNPSNTMRVLNVSAVRILGGLVGKAEGKKVGDVDGLGLTEGRLEGCTVVVGLGEAVGAEDGTGDAVGCADTVGTLLGAVVLVGCVVGSYVGKNGISTGAALNMRLDGVSDASSKEMLVGMAESMPVS